MSAVSTHKELKLRARHQMAGAFWPCMGTGVLVVAAALLLTTLQQSAGGAFPLYYWQTAGSDIASSVSLSVRGLFAALRVEEMGMGISIAITPRLLGKVVGLQLLCAAVAAPLRMGCVQRLWAIRRGEPGRSTALFGWYADPRRGGRAVVSEVLLTALQLAVQMVCSVPALLVLNTMGATLEGFTAAMWTAMAGLAVSWCVMTRFQNVRYLLTRGDDVTVARAWKENFALLGGAKSSYLRFRLSFVVWDLFSAFTNDVFQLYLFPYKGLANLEWIAENQ